MMIVPTRTAHIDYTDTDQAVFDDTHDGYMCELSLHADVVGLDFETQTLQLQVYGTFDGEHMWIDETGTDDTLIDVRHSFDVNVSLEFTYIEEKLAAKLNTVIETSEERLQMYLQHRVEDFAEEAYDQHIDFKVYLRRLQNCTDDIEILNFFVTSTDSEQALLIKALEFQADLSLDQLKALISPTSSSSLKARV